jgi:hypothetical protein
VKRPMLWFILTVTAVVAAVVSIRYFPQAFSIVALDIRMDRQRALADARRLAQRDALGPGGYRQAASFGLDEEAQTFVELEGGGKDTFTRMLRERQYSAYTWRVRHFREGETNETTIRFTPDGEPYGFIEKVKEDLPGAALESSAARTLAETAARARWNMSPQFALVEQAQERRPGGRVDHTFTYERTAPRVPINDGRYRLRLVVSGDRLTEVTHFIKIPEAFSRRYANMRSANQAIGIGSVVGMALLYVVGGIGVGLFFMLRSGWVIWRPPIIWGALVSLLQVSVMVNEFPLLWMSYDTALPRSTFLAQQLATLAAFFVGFGVFYSLSFMAAETLTRRAFGSHPQFWRVWSPAPGSTKEILGRTLGGYLLVATFFAYDVVLYLITTRAFGWWSPSEALLHPDVLATYVPWLSAIGNSFQAGFWEESLFRAVPLAGAALIGDRFGKRRLFLVIAFIVQAVIFGAGHAPYPNQPSYARPVELIVPSIGFGLLYVYFGLLPGIILHFAFDVVWFALPIFFASAPGIWFQKAMVVALTLVPLWIVFWRRVQVGRWTALSPSDRNAAWMPPVHAERAAPVDAQSHATLGRRARTVWLIAAVPALVVCGVAIFSSRHVGSITATRDQAAVATRRALSDRGVAASGRWRVMPTPDDGSDGPHEFVAETAGEAQRRALIGSYLPALGWNVRVATFEGDVADRAEEWRTFVSATGRVDNVQHRLPEARPGASLDEQRARVLVQDALRTRFQLNAGQVREVSARPDQLKARTDWTFTFADTTALALPRGEPRIEITLAGDEIAASRRFVFVPEDWRRQQRAADTRNTVLRVLALFVFGGLLVAAAVGGVIMWSRRQYTPRLFLLTGVLMFVVSAVKFVNNWPSVLAAIPTAVPLPVTLAGVVGIGLVGVLVTSSLVGLALGAQPRRLAACADLSTQDARRLGVSAGLVGAAIAIASASLRIPVWARFPDVTALGSFAPILQAAIDPITGWLMRTAIILATLVTIDRFTAGLTRRRWAAYSALVCIGFLASGAPTGLYLRGWLLSGVITSAGLLAVYVGLLRFDLTMVPLALGTMTGVGLLVRGAQRAFPGALSAAILSTVLIAGLAWWLFETLRAGRARPVEKSAVV